MWTSALPFAVQVTAYVFGEAGYSFRQLSATARSWNGQGEKNAGWRKKLR
jgi:hypothetical protein